jgi:hypothetical protein
LVNFWGLSKKYVQHRYQSRRRLEFKSCVLNPCENLFFGILMVRTLNGDKAPGQMVFSRLFSRLGKSLKGYYECFSGVSFQGKFEKSLHATFIFLIPKKAGRPSY